MKTILAFLFLICSSYEGVAQQFTRITTGSLVTDGGASRSVNWIDFNNDGYLDLFVSNGLEGGQNNFLYRNNGPDSGFTFAKITSGPIVSDNSPSDGASWGDYNNDGQVDCFVVNWYNLNNMLFRNNGASSFASITSGSPVTDGGYSESCTWGDYDKDGLLDLYVSNSGFNSASGPTANFLYHNVGGGNFTRVLAGDIIADIDFSRSATWCDVDNDGDLDLFVANERNYNNRLYRNMLKETAAATFTRITTGSIVNDGGSSWTASWGDYDNDGDQDLFVGNGWPFPNVNFLYRNDGNFVFTRILADTLVKHSGYHASSAWGDIDNDGDLDIIVTTAYSGSATTNLLYKNMLMETGQARFELVNAGSVTNDPGFSYGCAWGDYNRDGYLDLFVAKTFNEAENNALYKNDGAGNHWLQIRCVGTTSNTSGIGVKLRAKATIGGNSVWQLREVSGTSGLCGQNLWQHFGLGNATVIDTLKVEWPSDQVEIFTNVGLDRLITIVEGGGISSTGSDDGTTPLRFDLEQNYPNPYNPTTTIRFTLASDEIVSLCISDLLGREVARPLEEFRERGTHSLVFDATALPSGTYFYTLNTPRMRETRKMVLLR